MMLVRKSIMNELNEKSLVTENEEGSALQILLFWLEKMKKIKIDILNGYIPLELEIKPTPELIKLVELHEKMHIKLYAQHLERKLYQKKN